MDAYIDFCRNMWTLLTAIIQTAPDVVSAIWSNSALRQWICDSIADSPWSVYLIAFAILSLGGGIALTKREQRQLRRAADTFCTVRDISRWFWQK